MSEKGKPTDRLTEEQMEAATKLAHDVLHDPKVISTDGVKQLARLAFQSRQNAEEMADALSDITEDASRDWNAVCTRVSALRARLSELEGALREIVAVGTKLLSGYRIPSPGEYIKAYADVDSMARAALNSSGEGEK